ncbi:hypothetical protein GCM10009665_00870 [Kitasatospora nipponensis]|uniref:Uncharacterized protein n=1 Tax=Kitasatospora nipponensis TaxID=258049 RepID=A0ABP4G5X8_9ACTN
MPGTPVAARAGARLHGDGGGKGGHRSPESQVLQYWAMKTTGDGFTVNDSRISAGAATSPSTPRAHLGTTTTRRALARRRPHPCQDERTVQRFRPSAHYY